MLTSCIILTCLSWAQAVPQPNSTPQLFEDATFNIYFDGYYLWNTNRPIERVNLLRAYDVRANSFSINQTGLVFEKPVDAGDGRRWGVRLDLMFGQATETLQGSPQNELRPEVYRPLFQAFGTYVVPVAGDRLSFDFGKWASPLGVEGNYTKDQINYSRSYFFNFLPFYHMGFRTRYRVSNSISVAYNLVNGVQQTEDFNEFKSHHAQLVVAPEAGASWTLNYYTGKEQRGLSAELNPGRYHAVDTYASLQPTGKLTFALELDYVINRIEKTGPPQRVSGGAAYVKYQFTPQAFFGQRYERLNDVAGLFSGTVQNLNDFTSTLALRPDEGFEMRFEYRRDSSNRPFFPTSEPGRLKETQNTMTLGLLWWFGGKQGSW
jgi:hypothetical protein